MMTEQHNIRGTYLDPVFPGHVVTVVDHATLIDHETRETIPSVIYKSSSNDRTFVMTKRDFIKRFLENG